MEILGQSLQFLLTGLTTGSIYALIAVGFVTIYNVTGVINFAQGEFVMVGALTCVSLYQAGLPLIAAIPLAVLIAALVGLAMERSMIYPVRNSSFVTLIIITIAASILLRGLGLLIWGTYPLSLPTFSANKPILIGNAVITTQSLWVLGTLFVLLAVLYYFFEKTVMGTALRASMINPKAAGLMGINTSNMSALAFTLSAAVAAMAGIVMTPITGAIYDMGLFLGLKGFMAMVMGGMRNVVGAVIAGFFIGVLEAFATGYLSSSFSEAIAFAILLLMLFISPSGLFYKVSGKRV